MGQGLEWGDQMGKGKEEGIKGWNIGRDGEKKGHLGILWKSNIVEASYNIYTSEGYLNGISKQWGRHNPNWTSHHHMKLPVPGMGCIRVVGQRDPMITPKHPKPLPRLKVTLYKLIARPYC